MRTTAILLLVTLNAIGAAAQVAKPQTGEPTAVQTATPVEAEAQNLDDMLEKYWGKKREIRVIQKREFEKDGRVELSLLGGIIPNDSFANYYDVGAEVTYHLTETFGAGILLIKPFSHETDLRSFLQEEPFYVTTDLPEEYFLITMAEGSWTPLYGKFSFLGTKLLHMELAALVGAGMLNTSVLNIETGQAKKKFKPMGSLGAGLRFWFSSVMAARFDTRVYFHSKAGSEANLTGLSTPVELTLGVSYLF